MMVRAEGQEKGRQKTALTEGGPYSNGIPNLLLVKPNLFSGGSPSTASGRRIVAAQTARKTKAKEDTL